MPLVKHGLPVTPVQFENVSIPHYLDGFRVLFLSYDGQKPLSPDVHAPLADWVKRGGVLVFCDDGRRSLSESPRMVEQRREKLRHAARTSFRAAGRG